MSRAHRCSQHHVLVLLPRVHRRCCNSPNFAVGLATAATWAITYHNKLWTRHRELLLFCLAAIYYVAYLGPVGERRCYAE